VAIQETMESYEVEVNGKIYPGLTTILLAFRSFLTNLFSRGLWGHKSEEEQKRNVEVQSAGTILTLVLPQSTTKSPSEIPSLPNIEFAPELRRFMGTSRG
jgi:hypothetical protein